MWNLQIYILQTDIFTSGFIVLLILIAFGCLIDVICRAATYALHDSTVQRCMTERVPHQAVTPGGTLFTQRRWHLSLCTNMSSAHHALHLEGVCLFYLVCSHQAAFQNLLKDSEQAKSRSGYKCAHRNPPRVRSLPSSSP